MKKSLLLKCAATGIFLVLAVMVLGLFETYTHTDREPLYLTPLLDDTMGWDIYTVENDRHQPITIDELRKMGPEKTYYLSRNLTQELEDQEYTFLQLSSRLPCAVFLDDRLLYTTCPDSVLSIDQVSFPDKYEGLWERGESVRCTLSGHFASSRLTIATTTGSSEYGPTMPGIILSSEAAESETAMTTVSKEMIPAVGFAVMALLMMIVWLFAFFQGIYNYQVLLPIMAALLQAFSHLRQFEFLSASSTALDSPLTQFIPAVSLLLPLIYLCLQIKEKRIRILSGCILGISSVIAFISPVAGLFGGLPFSCTFLTANEILYFPLTALLIFTVWETKRGNTELRLFLSGLGIIISCIAILYMGSILGKRYYADQISLILRSVPEHTPSSFFNWCTFILFLLSSLIGMYKIIRHTANIHTDLALQTERSKQLDRQLSAQKDFYDARLSHEKEIRSLQHDMNGHLNTLSLLLGDDKLTEAKNYLDGITEYHGGRTSKIFCSNPYINAVLQNYMTKCLEHHVKLVYHIGIGDHKLPATELCLILNNALENALDAVLPLPKPERVIKIQAAVRQNLLLLRISNPFHGNVKTDRGLPLTTKYGKEHGYGLSNIRQAAERKGGSMEYHIENEYFVLDVTLPVIQETTQFTPW